MTNQLSLIVSTTLLASAGVRQKLQSGVSLVKRCTIQNVSDPAEPITIGTAEQLEIGGGVLLNSPPASGQAGGSIDLDAPEDVSDAYIDLSKIYWIGAATTAKLVIVAMVWEPRYPGPGGQGNVVHKFYEQR